MIFFFFSGRGVRVVFYFFTAIIYIHAELAAMRFSFGNL